MSKQHHPDLNPGDEASHNKFVEINHAYEILSDVVKRREYDASHMPRSHHRPAGTGPGPRRPSQRPFRPPDNFRASQNAGFGFEHGTSGGNSKQGNPRKPHFNYQEWEKGHGIGNQSIRPTVKSRRQVDEEPEMAQTARIVLLFTIFTLFHLMSRVFIK